MTYKDNQQDCAVCTPSKILTIITVCYNIKDEIERTLESITNQSWQSFEWIVVDGGSTDGTLDIIKKYKNRIDILISEKDGGIYNAMNKGIKASGSKWLNFMNGGDCFADKNVLEKIFDNKDYDADVLYGKSNIINEDGSFVLIDYPRKLDKNYFYKKCINHQASFIRRELFEKYGLYNENYRIVSDCEKWMIYIDHRCKFQYLDEIVSCFYKGGVSSNKEAFDNELNLLRNIYYKNKIYYYLSCCLSLFNVWIKRMMHQNIRKNIFSIRDWQHSNNRIYRIITFMGIDIKYRIPNEHEKDDYHKFLSHKLHKNTVLMVEINSCHGECLPGMAKYFLDLGYNVDVLIPYKEYLSEPFVNFNDERINIFTVNYKMLLKIMNNKIITKYSHVYFNSDKYYNNWRCVDAIFKNMKLPMKKIIMMMHHADDYNLYRRDETHKLVALCHFPVLKGADYKRVNTHYFGENKIHIKNDITKFVTVGNIEAKRKNHVQLINTVNTLIKQNIKKFKIIIIARCGSFYIPPHLAEYFDLKINLNYQDMYDEIQNADFYLTLLDPENPEHDRYLKYGASGSYQLIYGFLKPALTAEKFISDINGFNEDNAIVYQNNQDFAEAMIKAINMSKSDYNKKVAALKNLQSSIYQESLDNLCELLK